MPMPDQAPAAEEEAAEPAQDQAAEAAAEEEKDYKALYEEALAQSRFDYQSVRHCSKTAATSSALCVCLITSQFDTAPKPMEQNPSCVGMVKPTGADYQYSRKS